MKTPQQWLENGLLRTWCAVDDVAIAAIQSDARAELEDENEALRERLQKAEAACALWSATFQKYESFDANGKHTVNTYDVADDYRSCRNDCGKGILDRMKAMEEILDGLMCQKFTRKLGSPCDCDACRWKNLKESK